jgi:hypothetical protein
MELIKEFSELDKLIEKMGATPRYYDFPAPPWGGHVLEIADIKTDNTGRIVDIAGRLSLTYVQKQRVGSKYKFHIAICATLTAATNADVRSKYIVTSEQTFKIIREYNDGRTENTETELKVCKHCLIALNYENYNQVGNESKKRIYRNFKL